MLNLIAWIQNPDKSQKDLIFNNGEFVKFDDFDFRDEASKKIFETESLGKEIYNDNGLCIISCKSLYLIKLQTSKLDESNRTMPILMLVKNYKENSNSELKTMIMKTLYNSKYNIEEGYINQILSKINQNFLNHFKIKKVLILWFIGVFLLALLILIKYHTKQ